MIEHELIERDENEREEYERNLARRDREGDMAPDAVSMLIRVADLDARIAEDQAFDAQCRTLHPARASSIILTWQPSRPTLDR